jgi:hypothetical protein
MIFSAAAQAVAQDAAADFKKINAAYSTFEDLSMNIQYKVFSSYTAVAPIDESTGTYKKRGQEYFNSLKGFETLVTTEYMVSTDIAAKQIVVKPAKKISVSEISGIDMEKMLKVYQRVEPINVSKDVKGYRVYFKEGTSPLSKMEMHYSASTFLIEQMIMFYREAKTFDPTKKQPAKDEQPRLEISFLDIQTAPNFSTDDFSLARYFKDNHVASVPNSTYKDYKVVNLKN